MAVSIYIHIHIHLHIKLYIYMYMYIYIYIYMHVAFLFWGYITRISRVWSFLTLWGPPLEVPKYERLVQGRKRADDSAWGVCCNLR